jgi:hypothetical protein
MFVKNETMKLELSREAWVKLKLFETDKFAPTEELEPAAGEKNPRTDSGVLANKLRVTLDPLDTLPDPTTDGISRKLTGMDLAERTTFSRILSLPYCSSTSRYADDMALKLTDPVTPAQPDKRTEKLNKRIRRLEYI